MRFSDGVEGPSLESPERFFPLKRREGVVGVLPEDADVVLRGLARSNFGM